MVLIWGKEGKYAMYQDRFTEMKSYPRQTIFMYLKSKWFPHSDLHSA